MTSSPALPPSHHRDCIVTKVLKSATEELQEALSELSSNEEKNANGESNIQAAAHDARDTIESNDPDDLAAAFLAKQAAPPSLPVKEWTRVMLLNAQKSGAVSQTTPTKVDVNITRACQQEVNALYREFQKAIKDE